ncbi:MAG: EAL domain-containing protein [Candidatus Dormibacteraeota bacterium]|nr:EAL domain-containing protein [Candidatus Dormibacteraeota bacterium]
MTQVIASPGGTSWSTHQLSEFLVSIAASDNESAAAACAIQWAAEALEAEVAAIVVDGRVVDAVGYPRGHVPGADLVAVAENASAELTVAGLGTLRAISEPIGGIGGSLVLGRSGDDGFGAEELGLLRAMARTLSMTMRTLRMLEKERGLREEGEQRVAENARLLTLLQERQALLERLSKIQVSISRRAPLPEVLDTIVAGAHELLGDEVVGLRLLDKDDPRFLNLVSSVGVTRPLRGSLAHTPVGEGVGGRAVMEDRLIIVEDYENEIAAFDSFVSAHLQSAMAAPIHEGGVAVGSIVVATYKKDRLYTESEREMLLAFAHHASIALNDAKAVDQMRHLAYHDVLTGLPNRALFLEHLSRAVGNARRSRHSIAVLFLDLDRFKLVNDSLGHPAGDKLLTAVAGRLRSALRTSDLAARLGGDEFAVLAEDTTVEGARTIAEAITDSLRDPFDIEGQELSITGSTGVVIDHGGSTTADALLRNADLAMYRAKMDGAGRYLLFEPDMHVTVSDRVLLESRLRRAVRQDDFVVHYQPIVWLDTDDIVTVEALVRWRREDGTLVAPGEFLPVAEETGLIAPIGRSVIRQAMQQVHQWQRALPHATSLNLSVNLSPRQLQQPDVVKDMVDLLTETDFNPARLVVEITETALMRDTSQVNQRLRELTGLGVRIALDDFGTGYSSLTYLRTFPIDLLKVDKSFIADVASASPEAKVARAIIEMARTLRLETVAEGVEEAAQVAELVRLRCRMGQGFYFAKPLPARDMGRLLRSREPGPDLEVMQGGALAG